MNRPCPRPSLLVRVVGDSLFYVSPLERLEITDAELATEQLPHVVDVVLLCVHDAVAVAIERVVRQFVTDKTVDRGPECLMPLSLESRTAASHLVDQNGLR